MEEHIMAKCRHDEAVRQNEISRGATSTDRNFSSVVRQPSGIQKWYRRPIIMPFGIAIVCQKINSALIGKYLPAMPAIHLHGFFLKPMKRPYLKPSVLLSVAAGDARLPLTPRHHSSDWRRRRVIFQDNMKPAKAAYHRAARCRHRRQRSRILFGLSYRAWRGNGEAMAVTGRRYQMQLARHKALLFTRRHRRPKWMKHGWPDENRRLIIVDILGHHRCPRNAHDVGGGQRPVKSRESAAFGA